MALASGVSHGGPVATLIATIVFLGSGMRHGAYDIALLARAGRVRLAVGRYVAIVGEMPVMCVVSPPVALVLFVAVSSVHFGKD